MDGKKYTVADALDEPWLPVMRELVRAYQAFARRSQRHVHEMGLTPAQFDVIATLGNTAGMTFKDLGRLTLITKGCLTGIVDRLQQKGLVDRVTADSDRRCTLAQLTAAGEAVFERVFPEHIRHLSASFGRLSAEERRTLLQLLVKLKKTL